MISAARNVAAQVSSLLHFSVPDEGPLADADTYMPDFMKLLAGGIRSNAGSVLDRVRSLASQIREMVQEIDIVDLPNFNLPDLNLPDPWGGKGDLPDLALAGGGSASTTNNNQRTINMGGIHLTVNGYNVRDDDALATMVANKINDMMDEDSSVFK